jgi:DNA (cytosine-5)-methyltransferase 1
LGAVHHRSRPTLKVVGLFSGIGGLELGFEAAGFDPILVADSDELCRAVLSARLRGVDVVGDVADIRSLPRTDALVAGFPCQPYSQAGRLGGLRAGGWHLSQIFRLIDSGAASPAHVVLENVPFIVHLDAGRALLRILKEFERRKYRWAYRVIDTVAFKLPQRRRRWFLVASRTVDPAAVLLASDRDRIMHDDINARGFYWTEGNRGIGWADEAIPPLKTGSGIGIPAPPAIWDRSRAAIWTPDIRDAERLQGFKAGWTEVAEGRARRARWTMVGNAVSVPVATWVAQRLRDAKECNVAREAFDRNALPRAAFYDGRRRYASPVGEYPVRRLTPKIMDFLDFAPQPLSRRATQGFRERYLRSPLQQHADFVAALEHHESAHGQ